MTSRKSLNLFILIFSICKKKKTKKEEKASWTRIPLPTYKIPCWNLACGREGVSMTRFRTLQGSGRRRPHCLSPARRPPLSLDLKVLLRTWSQFLVLFAASLPYGHLCFVPIWRAACVLGVMNGGPQDLHSTFSLPRRNNHPRLCQHGPENWKGHPKRQELCGETGGPLPRSARAKRHL